MNILSQRSSGILLHPTSLPGRFGSGDLGAEAHRFVEFLAASGQRWWQMLPVGPPGAGASPYDSASSFAGSPLLISLEELVHQGYLESSDLDAHPRLENARFAQYGASGRFRGLRLRKAFECFEQRATAGDRARLQDFVAHNHSWLSDYSLYQALKQSYRGLPWTAWEPSLRGRESAPLETARHKLAKEIRYQNFLQFVFDRQWSALRNHAHALGVLLLGDVPMFVAHDGADVWASPQCFLLDEKGEQRVVAGVPPDYFNPEGQRWGNPIYAWEELQRTGYAWWILRLKAVLARFDAVRLDHFIGFHHYWEIPRHTEGARQGRFVQVPGVEFLTRVRESLGQLPFIAEDLGLVTPEVQRLRERFELPGMRVLQFAFVDDSREYQPHRYPESSVVYTGTHDTDTLMGWLSADERAANPDEAARLRNQRARALGYAGKSGQEPHWDIVRIALMSVAKLAIFPIQDLLGLGTWARMNLPGTTHGNWRFRLGCQDLTAALATHLGSLCETYERIPQRPPTPQ